MTYCVHHCHIMYLLLVVVSVTFVSSKPKYYDSRCANALFLISYQLVIYSELLV